MSADEAETRNKLMDLVKSYKDLTSEEKQQVLDGLSDSSREQFLELVHEAEMLTVILDSFGEHGVESIAFVDTEGNGYQVEKDLTIKPIEGDTNV